jgi:hypothetical protein
LLLVPREHFDGFAKDYFGKVQWQNWVEKEVTSGGHFSLKNETEIF